MHDRLEIKKDSGAYRRDPYLNRDTLSALTTSQRPKERLAFKVVQEIHDGTNLRRQWLTRTAFHGPGL